MPSLVEVAEISPGVDRSTVLDPNEIVSFVPMASVSEVTGSVTSEEGRPLSEVLKGFTAFHDRDVLVAKITPCFENGKIAHARIQKRLGFGSTEFHVIRAHADKLHDRYLFHFLRQPRIREAGERRMTGSAGQRRVPRAFLEELDVPLPPLPEQRRIAAILDKADALRAKRREAIAKLDQLLQSVFLDMFGDPVTNPKGWPKAALAELFDIARGGSPRPIDAYITDDPGGINWIMIGDTIEGSKYITGTRKRIKPEGAKRSRLVKPGDFLLTNSMRFGRPYIMRTHGCIHDGWLVLSPKDSRTGHDFLFSALASPSIYSEFARRAPGATVKSLNIDLVSGVEIIVPPIDLQGNTDQVPSNAFCD